MENIESASILTIKAYKTDLNQAYSGCPQFTHPQNHPISSGQEIWLVTRPVLTKWGELSLSSRNRKIATLKSFFNWLFQEGHINKNFSHQMVCPKRPKKIPHFLSVDEVASILSYYSKADKTEREQKEITLFLLLYGGGLRISEGCSLKWKDINLDERRLLIHGKGNKERMISLPQFCIDFLKKFQTAQTKHEYIFGDEPLNPRTGYDFIKTCGAKGNLLNPLHPHALRHSFATHLLASGANLRTLQKILGHESLQATEKYTHLNIDALARTVEAKHPLSKIKI